MTYRINRYAFIAGAGIVIAALALAGWVWLRPVHHLGNVDASPFENDMVEALVRGILQEDGLRDSQLCFLGFGEGGTSPGADFIARFDDCRNPSVAALNSTVNPPINRVLEKKNGHAGTVIKIIDIHQTQADVYNVTVSLSCLPAGHDHVSYHVANVSDTWVARRNP
jgi:hypothetical protein